jgi:hypothetical protein
LSIVQCLRIKTQILDTLSPSPAKDGGGTLTRLIPTDITIPRLQ